MWDIRTSICKNERKSMRYLLASYTDKGKVREVNQDSLLVLQEDFDGEHVVFAVVCDGIGGLERGERASADTAEAFGRWFREELRALAGQEDFEDALYDSWESLLQKVHREIGEYGRVENIRLGTTATAMLFWQKDYYIVHIGDCRVYEIGDGIVQLTRDQIQAGLEDSDLSGEPGQIKKSKGSHVLLQGVGASKIIRPTYYSGKIKENTVYLLCTDGFRNKVSEGELYQAFAPEELTNEKAMEERGRRIAEIVMGRGEKDNISVISAKCFL